MSLGFVLLLAVAFASASAIILFAVFAVAFSGVALSREHTTPDELR